MSREPGQAHVGSQQSPGGKPDGRRQGAVYQASFEAVMAILIAAGALALEITFTTPQADRVLATLRAENPSLPIGAGTLMSGAEATRALQAGADFHVSPCWSDPVAERVLDAGKPYMPGAATPGEVWHHWQAGAAVVSSSGLSALPIGRAGQRDR